MATIPTTTITDSNNITDNHILCTDQVITEEKLKRPSVDNNMAHKQSEVSDRGHQDIYRYHSTHLLREEESTGPLDLSTRKQGLPQLHRQSESMPRIFFRLK